jgi:hypothetical protein
MVLFRLYYFGLAPYENARHFLGLSERSWVNWTEVRHHCGKELLRRGMFPLRKYFSSIEWRSRPHGRCVMLSRGSFLQHGER